MKKNASTILALMMIALSTLIFTPQEIKAGDPGYQNGDIKNAFQFCLKETGDTYYYRIRPKDCRCVHPTRDNCTPRSDFAFPFGRGSKPNSRLSNSNGSAPETMLRQTSATLFSIMILFGGLGVIALSVKRLLRPATNSPTRLNGYAWKMPLPSRAIGFASIVAIIGLASGAWLSIQSTNASSTTPVPKIVPRLLQLQSNGAADPKFSSAMQFGDAGSTAIGGTAVDKQGNTYVAGGFQGVITFNTAPQPTRLESSEGFDVFIAKLDATGKPLWARMANGATGLTFTDPDTNLSENFAFNGALSLAIDAQGNAYIGGGFVKGLFFKGASGSTVATLNDNNDDINFELFVAKYDTNGTLAWARGGMSGAPDDPEVESDLDADINGITDIVVDRDGNPYVAGTFSGANFLGQTVTPKGGRDVLLSRLNPANGNPVWISNPGSADTDAATGLAIDDNANIYVIGEMDGSITFPTQPTPTTLVLDDEFSDSFIAKYDKDGRALFAKQIGGTQPIDGTHIAATGAGEIYLTGAFAGTAKFDSITVNDPSQGSGSSGFLTKYNTNGNAVWARIFGRADEEASDGDTIGYRVAVDPTGSPYVSGIFTGEATFGGESTDAARTLLSGETEDKFIAHYDAAGNFRWVKQPDESGSEGVNGFTSPDTPVEVLPLRLVYNDAARALILTSDFQGTLILDNITLKSGETRQAFIATLPLDASVQFSAAGYTVNENTGTATITVTRTGDTSGAVSINYATSDGTAGQRSDYLATSGTLSFAAGETSKTFTVSIIDDAYVEGNETINLTLSNPNPSTVTLSSPVTATLTILDNDTTQATTNPIDDTNFFVRQQYLDFLNREPDSGGFAYWTNLINGCGTDASCLNSRRVSVSAAFFIEQEFQQTSFFVYRVRRASLGTQPTYAQFTADRNQIGLGSDANKTAFTQSFAQLPEFLAKYPASQTGSQFINALLANVKQSSGIDLSSKQNELANEYLMGSTQTESRARVIRKLVEYAEYTKAEYNPAFVLAEYFGYLRRDPDAGGYQFWLDVLNNRVPNNYRSMVCAFITSAEYQLRFSSVITRTDKVCGSLAP